MNFNEIEMRRETIFKDAVLSAAEAKGMELISEAQRDAAKQLANAQATCEQADHDVIMAGLNRDADREHSATKQQVRAELLRHRSQMVAQLFGEVERRLQAFSEGGGYQGWLLEKLEKAAAGLPDGQPTVWLRKADLGLAAAVEKQLPGAEVKQDEAIRLGGAKLQSGHVVFDLTLDTALREEQDRFVDDSKLTL